MHNNTSTGLDLRIKKLIASKQQQNLLRFRSINNINLIRFDTNDYLDLADNPRIREFYIDAYKKYPSGSAGSPLICGYYDIHQQLEHDFCKDLSTDSALLFSAGYTANLAVLQLLKSLEANIILDKKVHASIYDGIKLAQINNDKIFRFNHLDINHCKSLQVDNSIILTESLFSMSGQFADLNSLINIGKVIVDEAHAFGVYAEHGLGLAAGISTINIPLRVITFGKAFCSQGAIILGDKLWIDALLQVARPYIYSTSMSPAHAYAIWQTFSYIKSCDMQRQKLFNNIAYFLEHTNNSRLNWTKSSSHIQQLILGCPIKAQKYSKLLLEKGILCTAIRQPTVTKYETGLRLVLTAKHTKAQIDKLFLELSNINIV